MTRFERKYFLGRAFLFLIFVVGGVAYGATVTVDPSQAEVPGVNYQTIGAAADNINFEEGVGGDAWGDGNDDTILLTPSLHIVEGEVSPSPFNPDTFGISPPAATETLTIRSAGPGNAILRFRALFAGKQRLWDIETPGTYFFENLTHIGSIDPGFEDPLVVDLRTVFRVDTDDTGDEIHVTVRNCIVTANDGSDGPVTDYSAPFPAGRAGTFMRAFYNGDGDHIGSFSFLAENCVFAFLANNADLGIPGINTGRGGGIEVFREDDATNPLTPNATKEVILRNCLIANCLDEGFAIGGASQEATLTIENCLVTNVNDRVLLLPGESDDAWRAGTYNFVHSIIESTSNAIRNNGSNDFEGTINLDEVTIVNPGMDAILLTNQNPGEAGFNFSDVIAFGINSLLRLQPDPGADSGPAPAVLTANSIATDSVVLGSQAPSVQGTLNAAVITTENPTFQSISIPPVINGITRWDSQVNGLFDVGNPNYAGLGTSNPDLRGGAEFAFVTPPSSIKDWSLYE